MVAVDDSIYGGFQVVKLQNNGKIQLRNDFVALALQNQKFLPLMS